MAKSATLLTVWPIHCSSYFPLFCHILRD